MIHHAHKQDPSCLRCIEAMDDETAIEALLQSHNIASRHSKISTTAKGPA